MDQSQKFSIDLKEAMKTKDTDRVLVLRSLLSSLKNALIEKKSELTAEEEEVVVAREAKKRQDAMVLYEKANRKELVKKEKAELEIIMSYLPKQMSETELRETILKMKEMNELEVDFGKSMKLVLAKLQGRADGKMVARIVREVI